MNTPYGKRLFSGQIEQNFTSYHHGLVYRFKYKVFLDDGQRIHEIGAQNIVVAEVNTSNEKGHQCDYLGCTEFLANDVANYYRGL